MNPLDLLEERVETLLGELGLAAAFRRGGVAAIDAGDALVVVSCLSREDTLWVRVASVVLVDVEPSLELLHRLLQLGHDVRIGAFQLFEDRTLAFSATLFGHNLDAESLGKTVRYVAHMARTAAPALAEVAGGRAWPALRDDAQRPA
jgi:hypothetical protein